MECNRVVLLLILRIWGSQSWFVYLLLDQGQSQLYFNFYEAYELITSRKISRGRILGDFWYFGSLRTSFQTRKHKDYREYINGWTLGNRDRLSIMKCKSMMDSNQFGAYKPDKNGNDFLVGWTANSQQSQPTLLNEDIRWLTFQVANSLLVSEVIRILADRIHEDDTK